MTDPPRDTETRHRPGTPRWVIALGLAVIVAVLVFIVLMFVGGGEHGPGRHTGMGQPASAMQMVR